MISNHLAEYAEDRFRRRNGYLRPVLEEIGNRFDSLSHDEAVCMKFLYATMPLQDAGAYSFDVFLGYVRHALWLRDTYDWCAELAEDLFIHYVMYYRINSEDICDCRRMFHDLAADRVRGLDLRAAVLSVNYWCAENMVYESSDGRTESPLTAYLSGAGRCGEESTFAVTVLRSLGIPARQVYTPRWAHCDDNHAWVEVYLEGDWHFLGACEPEEVLDRGWFSNASSRAMLVHSRTFSDYVSQMREEEADRDGVLVYHNATARYTGCVRLQIQVKDSLGKPAARANVQVELLNMAQYSTIAALRADQNGEVYLTLGKGTVRLAAWTQTGQADMMVNTRSTDRVLLQLQPVSEVEADRKTQEKNEFRKIYWEAPSDFPMNRTIPAKEQKELRRRKLAEAERIRKARIGGYYREEAGRRYPQEEQLLRLAGGNFEEVYAFLSKDDNPDRRKLLHSLAPKDWKDVRAEVLETFLEQDAADAVQRQRIRETFGEDVYIEEVLCPRIALEAITPYRPYIQSYFTEEEKVLFKADPEELYRYIENHIHYAPEEDYSVLCSTPAACLKLKQGSPQSRRILFTAVCRSLGIPAAIDKVTGQVSYRTQNGSKVPGMHGGGAQETGTLKLLSQDGSRWIYGQTWTIARQEERLFRTLDCEGICFEENGLTLPLVPGTYRLLTSSRMPNGNQYEAGKLLHLEAGQVYETDLPVQDGSLEDMLTESDIPDFEIEHEDGKQEEMSQLLSRECGPAGCVLMFLEVGCEPTEHVLNEILQTKERFRHSGARLIAVLQGPSDLGNATFHKVLEQLDLCVCYAPEGDSAESVARRMYVDADKLPLLVVIRSGMTGVYACGGYNVGSVDLMLKILNRAPV